MRANPRINRHHVPRICLPQRDFTKVHYCYTHRNSAPPGGPLRVFHPSVWPLKAPRYLGGGLPGLSSALWCLYPHKSLHDDSFSCWDGMTKYVFCKPIPDPLPTSTQRVIISNFITLLVWVLVGVPKTFGTQGPIPWNGAEPLKICFFLVCVTNEFGHSRSNWTSVIMELYQKI